MFGTYWPYKHTDSDATSLSNSLWAASQSWLHKNGVTESPIDYVRRLSISLINSAFKTGSNAAIYGGDLNATWLASEPGGCYTLSPWALENQFINGPLQIATHRRERFHTHQSGSWIDHVLHVGPLGHIDILGAMVGTGVEWTNISDHRPLVAVYRVSPPSTKKPVLASPPQTRIELNRSDPRALARYDVAMRKLIDRHPLDLTSPEAASDYLFTLERATVQVVKRINPRLNPSIKTDGAPPTLLTPYTFKPSSTSAVISRANTDGNDG